MRWFSDADWSALMKLERQCFRSQPWTKKAYQEFFADGAEAVVIGTPLTAVVWWHGPEIASLAVASSERGKGFGRRLLGAALRNISRESDVAWLDVRPSAVPALKLYLSVGFEVTNFKKHYYGRNDGALHLVKRF